MTPTSDGPINPGDVAMQLEIPMMMPAYFGAMSRGLTIKPVNDSPKKATAMHMNETANSDRSGNPDRIINNADPAIPRGSKSNIEHNRQLSIRLLLYSLF